MPTFLVSAPNGKKYRVNGPEGSTGEQAVAYIQQQLGAPKATPEQSGFFSSMKEGASNLLNTKAAAQFATASPAEQDALRKQFLESRASDTQGIAFEDVDNLPEFWQWLKQTAGQSAGALVVPGLGAVAAKKLAGAPNPVAKGVGYALMGAQYVIDNLGRQAQEQEQDIAEGKTPRPTTLGTAILGAAAQTGLDAALLETAFLPLLSKFPLLKNLFEAGEKETAAGVKELVRAYKAGELKLANGLYKGVMFGAAVEIPQEVAQQLIERWQAGLPLADTEAKKEYFESAVGALALGGAFGGVQQTMVQHGKIGLARDAIRKEEDEVAAQQAERERLIQEQAEAAKAAAQPVTPPAAVVPGTQPVTDTTTTVKEKKPVAQGYLGGVKPEEAADFVKNLAAQNNGVETRIDEWRDALMAQYNLSEENANSLVKVLHDNKVLSRKFGKAVGGHYLNKLYEPTLTDQRKDYLAKLDPEIRRVADIASEEDKTLLNSLITKITPSLDKKGKVIRVKADTVNALFKSMDDLLAKYKAPAAVEPAVVEPAVVEPAVVEPAAVEPAAVEPAAVEPAAVEPVVVEPAAVEPVVVEPVVEDTRSNEDKVMEAFTNAGKANTKLIQETLGLNNVEAIAFMQTLYKAGLIAKSGRGYKLKKVKPESTGETTEKPAPAPVLKNTTGESTEVKAEALLARLQQRGGVGHSGKEVATQRNMEERRLTAAVEELNKTPVVHQLKPIKGEEGTRSVTLKYSPDGYSVSALDPNGVAVGTMSVSQEGNKNSVGNMRVAADYRRHGIATAMFNGLRKLHPTLNFEGTESSEEGDAFISNLYADRVGTKEEIAVPERIQERANERLAEKRRANDIPKVIARVKEIVQNGGELPVAHALANELNIPRHHVDAAYQQMADEGYIQRATHTETIEGKQYTRSLNYYVVTDKLTPKTEEAVSEASSEALAEDIESEEQDVEPAEGREAKAVHDNVLDYLLTYGPTPANKLAELYDKSVHPYVERALRKLIQEGKVTQDAKGNYIAAGWEKFNAELTAIERSNNSALALIAQAEADKASTGKEEDALTTARRIMKRVAAMCDFLISRGQMDLKKRRKIFRDLINPKKKGEDKSREIVSDLAIKANKELLKMGKGVTSIAAKGKEVSHSRTDIYNRSTHLTDATFDMLDGKPYTAYLDFLAKTGGMFDQIVVRAISNVFNSYSKAGLPVRIVSVDNKTGARKAYGAKWQNVNGAATGTENGIVVYLTNNVEGRSGYTAHTIFHEFLHAATMAAYQAGKTGQASPVQVAAARDLDKLTAHVVSQVNEMAKAGKFTKQELEFLASTNFLGNADKSGVRRGDAQELLAWGIGDETARGILEKIQYTAADRGRTTVWDELVSILRRLLGLPAHSQTAFSELLRTFSAFVQETAAPEAAAGVTQYSATATTQRTFTAEPLQQGTFEDHVKRMSQQESVRLAPRKGIRETLSNLFSHTNWEKIVTNFQSERRPLQRLSEYLSAAGVLNVLDRVNDLYGEITRSMAMSENILNETMWRHMVDLDKQIDEMSKATGKTKDVVLAELQLYAMARTEKERREAFYEMNVPLNNKLDTKLDAALVRGIMVTARDADGKPIKNAPAVALDTISAPPARLRQIIMAELNKNQNLVSNGYAERMRKALHEMIHRNNMQNVDGTVDGFSPILGPKGVRLSTDINDRVYDVIGAYSRNQINDMLSHYNTALAHPKTGPILQQMFGTATKKGSLQLLQEATIAADKRSNYWSNPVDNRKAFYGWKYYVPLKGRGETKSEDAAKAALDELDFTGDRLGAGFNDVQGEMGGRASDSENPILQTMVDATKAAIRYGRVGSMNAIANLIDKDPRTGKQYLKGKRLASIPFESRNDMINNKDYGGPDKFFVYRPDGSIDIYQVADAQMKEAIRRTFRERNRLVELGNSITSAVGHMHTRYNVAFHPYNFVRDALTNAFTLGAEFGPALSAKLISAVATRTSQSGMLTKAAKIASLYRDGKLDEIRGMAAKGDKFAADALRFYELGGRVTYLSGTDIREQGERLMRDVRRGNVARMKEFIDGYVDNWADSFELTSRLATFGVMRDYYTSKGMTLEEAEVRASTYAKNLANFEQVGKYGREAGALFMFFRPAATGAVRAIDALMPAFQSWESYKKHIPEDILGNENSPEFKKIQKEFMARKQSARAMMAGLAGAGAFMWTMAWMMSDEDDDKRNRVATDKMALWTRNIRLPLGMFGEKYKESYLQLPWGFGLGAFGAMGAQVAGVAGGYTTIGEAIPNFITIALDSYVPVPVARIDPTENFPAFAATTFIPSVARPFVEYAMNVDSLGREIYNDRQTRYGDAFTGGRNTPQLWKDASRTLFNVTLGAVDVSPDTMLFWANNYVDGVSRIAQSGYGMSQFALTDRDFNVKEDFAPISSFIGRASNYDGEKFADLEQHMRELNQRYKSLERDPDMWNEYVMNNQNEYMALQRFNRDVQGWVKKLRSMRNQIEASDYSPRQKEEQLKQIQLATNFVKRGMLMDAANGGIRL